MPKKKRSIFIGHWCKSTYVKEVTSTLQNVIFKQKRFLNIQKLFQVLPWSEWMLTLIRLGFVRVAFSRGGQFNPPFIYQYNFIQLLNNLFKVSWKWKNDDIICYMLTSLLILCNKQMLKKIVNIDREYLKKSSERLEEF